MALERELWKRMRKAGIHLRKCGFKVHLCRIENDAGAGNPDVEGCIDGGQIWIELKSCERPKRASTSIRPKVRVSQDIWLQERVRAGCRVCYVLIQVGEAQAARLYLIPGHLYPKIICPEAELESMSVLSSPVLSLPEVLLRATEGF
jgi:hypothetical protein